MDMTYEEESAQHELGKALLQALRAGNTDEAKRLVEAGAPINWMEMNKVSEGRRGPLPSRRRAHRSRLLAVCICVSVLGPPVQGLH